MTPIPLTALPESSSALLFSGYDLTSKTCDRYNSDIFKTWLLLKPFYCMRGEEAAKLFYTNEFFERKDVMPKRVQRTRLGEKGVQSLIMILKDGAKTCFMLCFCTVPFYFLLNMKVNL
ncbi:hypothetical protein QA601_08710 [Chitinispirillales bacterium ANBcel5]|uniref:hypothetical protein n=1 Tax=Cellulosispirillum alkaliphilum TaxID=3039283 RepID=UPI002A541165|nr:hypothetical protein [Chitinispirillales bacterium ANBcel5]